MARSKSSKAKRFTRRQPKRGRRMRAHMGRVSPPVDVRSASDIPKALQRLQKGPITLVFVYADWCGHCHTFKPKFNNAVKTPNRDMEVVSINEKVLTPFNNAMAKTIPTASPIEPDGYPEVLIVNKMGKNVGNVPSSATENEIMSVVTSGNSIASTPAPNAGTGDPMSVSNVGEDPMAPMPTPVANNSRVATKNNSARTSTVPISNVQRSATLDVENTTLPVTNTGLVTPPVTTDDLISETTTPATQAGGSLFGALSSAAYTLAPAGVLLASLHALRSRRSRSRRGTRRHRRSRR
jgi:thiol-disulfide isomerase/thioredoxin